MKIIIIDGTVYKVTNDQLQEIKQRKETDLSDFLNKNKIDYIEVGPILFTFPA